MKKAITTFFALFLGFQIFAQEGVLKDTITRSAKIDYRIQNNELLLTPITPELVQIAGAPKAYYSYFWELGDGTFSKAKEPKHTYKNKGDYEVKLWVTNHYDNGKPPATRPQKVSISSASATANNLVASMENDFELLTNRDPVPEEEMVLVMRYKNPKQYVANGKLYLFYNERKFKNDNFKLEDYRAYYGEELITDEEVGLAYNDKIDDNPILYSSLENDVFTKTFQVQDSTRTDLNKTIEESKAYYRNWSIFNLDYQEPGEERNLFFTMKTPPEMLKDTSAIISIRGVYVPDKEYQNHTVKEKEMEIVTSHDPNKMSSNGTLLNYRLARFKTLKYKIQFQNDGEGPAKTIRLETDIPEMLDKSTLEVVDMYPKCEICPKRPVNYSCLDTTFTKEQAIFTFKNIHLPGTNQKGVQEKDSTKGFVKYKIKFGKDFHKKKTVSRTAIIFDKNEPIITNRSTTRFTPGISIGAKAGYNYYSGLIDSESYFLGATISPYKSYRWYWQAELLSSRHTFRNEETSSINEVDDLNQDVLTLENIINNKSYTNIDVEVPVLVRYNVNNFIGLGAGIQTKFTAEERTTTEDFIETIERIQGVDDRIVNSETLTNEVVDSFTNFRHGLLLDVTAGLARIGPSVGARYILHQNSQDNYWQFYAIWKF